MLRPCANDPVHHRSALNTEFKRELILAIQRKIKHLTGQEAAKVLDCREEEISKLRHALRDGKRRTLSHDTLLLMAEKVGLGVRVIDQPQTH